MYPHVQQLPNRLVSSSSSSVAPRANASLCPISLPWSDRGRLDFESRVRLPVPGSQDPSRFRGSGFRAGDAVRRATCVARATSVGIHLSIHVYAYVTEQKKKKKKKSRMSWAKRRVACICVDMTGGEHE